MTGDRYDVFISYARTDAPRARLIREKLSEFGLNVFFDAEGIDNGADFPEVIDRAVKGARCVLGLWSRNAFTGRWVRIESRIGLDQQKLVATIIDGMRPEELPAEFYNVNVESLADYRGQDDHTGWTRVVRAIGKRLGRSDLVSAPETPAPSPASAGFNLRTFIAQLTPDQRRNGAIAGLALAAVVIAGVAMLPGEQPSDVASRFSGNRVFAPNEASAASVDLNGEWQGSFVEGGREVRFDVEIAMHSMGQFTGRISENDAFGMSGGGTMLSEITGAARGDGSVSFVKAYNGAGGMTHRVQYEGRIEDGGRAIVGTWDTGRTRGNFRMDRR